MPGTSRKRKVSGGGGGLHSELSETEAKPATEVGFIQGHIFCKRLILFPINHIFLFIPSPPSPFSMVTYAEYTHFV